MVNEISTSELKKISESNQDNYIIVDVRSTFEYSSENIPNSKNIPLNKIRASIDELKKYEKVYLFCRSGNRSYLASNILLELGVVNPINVKGGIVAWKTNGFDIIKNPSSMSILRLIQIIMGLLLLTDVLLSKNYDANLILPTFMGAFILYSGITNKCLLNSCSIKN
ncbi:MAG: rhodanese-like domain-containing protein [Candidatus Sericytochromatia bacterium]